MTDECSEYECFNCGKQLWKRYFEANYGSEEGQETFCSKKCGKEFILKHLEYEEVRI